MFYSRMVGKVRKELENIGCFFNCEIIFTKVKEDIMFFKTEDKGVAYLIRYYERGGVKSLIESYKLLENNGIKLEEILVYNDNVVVCYDKDENIAYRMLNKNDLSGEEEVRKFARWSRLFELESRTLYNKYKNYFSLSNIKAIVKTFNLYNNKFLNYVIANFTNIEMKFLKLNKAAILTDFSLENIGVCEGTGEYIVCDLRNVFIGSRYELIDNFMKIIDEKYKSVFVEEYGKVMQDEQMIGRIVGCINNLYIASTGNANSVLEKRCLEEVCDEKMFEIARTVVEWC